MANLSKQEILDECRSIYPDNPEKLYELTSDVLVELGVIVFLEPLGMNVDNQFNAIKEECMRVGIHHNKVWELYDFLYKGTQFARQK